MADVFRRANPYVVRVRPEERLILEVFGNEYEAYRSVTKRLVPGVW